MEKKKNKIIKILVPVFILILIAVGASYAYSNWSYIGGVNTISSQEVSIDLLESNSEIINITNAIPMTDEEGLAQTDSFAFAVTSKMSQEKVINYTVSMEKLTPDTGYTFLNDNKIKIYIEDFEGNEVLEPTLVSNLNNYELTKGFHDHDSSHVTVQNKYRLKVWIDQSAETDAQSWTPTTKIQYKFKLGVTAEDQQTVRHTVNVVVNNGTVSPSTKDVVDGDRAQFTLTPTNSTSDAVVSCTNSQTGTIRNNTLTVSNVTSDTTCTVTFSPASTVLYTDGTLIINEKASDRSTNITTHGAVTNEYTPLSNQNTYVLGSYTSQPWYSQRTSVTSVEIGQHIEPTNTKYWFYNLQKVTQGDCTNLDTKNVTNMQRMFYQAGYDSSVTSFTLTGLDNWDTSKTTDMNAMFYYAGKSATSWGVGNLSSWDTSNVTDMENMFDSAGRSATTWSIGNLSNWDTSKVTNMSSMFSQAGQSATTWSIGDLSSWDTSKVTNMSAMFSQTGYNATTFDIGDLSSWDTSSVTGMNAMFSSAGYSDTTWSIGNLSTWNTSKVTNMGSMFSSAGYNATTWSIGDLSSWDTSKVTNMSSMFREAGSNATTWNSIGSLKVYATNMYQMFYNCPKAKATLNIYSNPASGTSGYNQAFYSAATASGSLITVNYSSTTTNIDNIVATKSSSSNVVKGVQLD